MGRTTFAVNRRNNREADVAALLARGEPLQGPVDHSVPVMSVTRADKHLAAILFGYACHPTTLSFTKWCGDYPGFAQLALEKEHPGAVALFVNTCGGDQNPLPRRTVELCEKYGLMLAEAVKDVLKRPLKPVSPRLQSAFAYVDLPYERIITREQLQTATDDKNAIRKRWAERMLKKLDAGEKFASAYPYPLHAWRLGTDTLMIGMGAETVVDYALRLKAQLGRSTWVWDTDDMIAYIPSRRTAEGGYEGDQPCRATANEGQRCRRSNRQLGSQPGEKLTSEARVAVEPSNAPRYKWASLRIRCRLLCHSRPQLPFRCSIRSARPTRNLDPAVSATDRLTVTCASSHRAMLLPALVMRVVIRSCRPPYGVRCQKFRRDRTKPSQS